MDVNEKGIKTAAATAMMVAGGGPGPQPEPIELTVDRPFLFIIHDRETGTILFMSRVLAPRG